MHSSVLSPGSRMSLNPYYVGYQMLKDIERRWNGETYSLFVLHGNIFDVFPVQNGGKLHYVPLKAFLTRRLSVARRVMPSSSIGRESIPRAPGWAAADRWELSA